MSTFVCSQDQVPHDDRCEEGVDAGYVFPERKGGKIPQHSRTKCLHQNLPQRGRPLQY